MLRHTDHAESAIQKLHQTMTAAVYVQQHQDCTLVMVSPNKVYTVRGETHHVTSQQTQWHVDRQEFSTLEVHYTST